MNYRWARDFTLQLINQYSVAGAKVPDSYNNQADYIKRIPALLDDAQMYVATTAAPISALDDLKNLRCDDNGAWLTYTMPDDCWQMSGAGLIRYDGDTFQRFHRYHPAGDNKIAVPKELTGEVQVEYYRYPRLLGIDPKDEAELDNIPPVQMSLPYYVAAQLVMQDDAFAFSALSNEFETRLARLTKSIHTDLHNVEDVYDA